MLPSNALSLAAELFLGGRGYHAAQPANGPLFAVSCVHIHEEALGRYGVPLMTLLRFAGLACEGVLTSSTRHEVGARDLSIG